MQLILFASILAASASALIPRQAPCCFGISPAGDSGLYHNDLSSTQYCIKDGTLTDSAGHPCARNPSTAKVECEKDIIPHGGFDVACDGSLTYKGNSQFYACAVGQGGNYVIRTENVNRQPSCIPITFAADSCNKNCSTAPPSALSPPVDLQPRQTQACGTTLSPGDYEFPHLIIPIDSSNPDTPLGDSYDGQVSPTISSLFQFDIPAFRAGHTCSLVFLFPEQSLWASPSYNISGSGEIGFGLLGAPVNQETTYNNCPVLLTGLGEYSFAPGNSYTIHTQPCPAGETVAYEMFSVYGLTELSFSYFEGSGIPPIGLYITVC